MRRFFLAAFLVVTGGELLSHIFHLEFLHHLCKPLIMVFLGLYYWSTVSKEDRSVLVYAAIFFSFLGDSLLMYDTRDPIYFMLGLGSFLIAHVAYIFVYRQHSFERDPSETGVIQKVRMAFPIILAGTGLVVVLYPRLGGLRLPVIVYALVLIVMVLNALYRYQRTNSASYWMVFSGAVLFMISDSMIAINKFLEPFNNAGLLIMVTYIAAQWLIIRGLIYHVGNRD